MKGEGKIIEAWPRLLKKPLKSDANVIPMGNGEKEMFVGRKIMVDLDAVVVVVILLLMMMMVMFIFLLFYPRNLLLKFGQNRVSNI